MATPSQQPPYIDGENGMSSVRCIAMDIGPKNLAISFIEITGGKLPPPFLPTWTPNCLVEDKTAWLKILAGFHINLQADNGILVEQYLSDTIAKELNAIVARDNIATQTSTHPSLSSDATGDQRQVTPPPAPHPNTGDEEDEDVDIMDIATEDVASNPRPSNRLYPRMCTINALSGKDLSPYQIIFRRLGTLFTEKRFACFFEKQYPVAIENQVDEIKNKGRLPVNWALSHAIQVVFEALDRKVGFKQERLIVFTAKKYGLNVTLEKQYPEYSKPKEGETDVQFKNRQYRLRKQASEWAGIKTCEANGQKAYVDWVCRRKKWDDDFDATNMAIQTVVDCFKGTRLNKNETQKYKMANSTLQLDIDDNDGDVDNDLEDATVRGLSEEEFKIELDNMKKKKRKIGKDDKSKSATRKRKTPNDDKPKTKKKNKECDVDAGKISASTSTTKKSRKKKVKVMEDTDDDGSGEDMKNKNSIRKKRRAALDDYIRQVSESEDSADDDDAVVIINKKTTPVSTDNNGKNKSPPLVDKKDNMADRRTSKPSPSPPPTLKSFVISKGSMFVHQKQNTRRAPTQETNRPHGDDTTPFGLKTHRILNQHNIEHKYDNKYDDDDIEDSDDNEDYNNNVVIGDNTKPPSFGRHKQRHFNNDNGGHSIHYRQERREHFDSLESMQREGKHVNDRMDIEDYVAGGARSGTQSSAPKSRHTSIYI